ncbi:MAG: energy transducer TonB [Daejeonella sp.]|nr:energy transducer TonB [Daejeonella sp.]
MKYFKTLILLLLAQYQNVAAQEVVNNSEADSSAVYKAENVDVKPSFPGGEKEFEIYFQKNFKSADNEQMPNLTGLHFTFIIERNGNLTNFQGLDEMSLQNRTRFINVLQNSRQWIPGIQNNSLVRTQLTLPFSLIIKRTTINDVNTVRQPFGGKKKTKRAFFGPQ